MTLIHLEFNHLVSCLQCFYFFYFFLLQGWQVVNKPLVVVRDVAFSRCWGHLILMLANYPLRWDPVPASCHGDIARASVNTGTTARNHPDSELTGNATWTVMIWPAHMLSLPTVSLFYYLKKGLYISQSNPIPPPSLPPRFFSSFLSERSPLLLNKMEIVYSPDV